MINMNLKALRKIHKYTQEEVADKINVSRQAVAKWESGETVPDINNCIALAELYCVSLDDLVCGPDNKEVTSIQTKGKHIFGTVKVGERGEIVIPKKAREVFDINPGNTILVLGDEAQGIALMNRGKFMQFIEAILKAEECKEE